MPRAIARAFCLLSAPALALACVPDPAPGHVDRARLLAADREPDQWLSLGRDFRAQRFSPLANITADNASRLGFAWEYAARSRRGRVEYGMEATPIVVDGVLYSSGPWGVVYAVDARTGQERWRYDPEVDGSYGRRQCCGVVNRGVAVWRGRVYVGTLDGWLVALDAATGREVWKVDTFEDRETRFYTITSPPQVAGNVVVIGNSGGEFGVRGYVTAYDLDTGRQAWRFYTVPRDPALGPDPQPEMARALPTWDPRSNWASGLGGTVWGEMTYDPELNLLYVGTGNSTPYPIWFRSPAGGDNLFLVSILAINPDSGRMVWYYQTVPGEIWDYTATANIVLADLPIGGRVRKVLMQAPKNGFYYVLDRATGEFLSARPFVHVNWASHIDSATGRPVLTGKGDYRQGPRVVFPTFAGGHNWQPMAYSPETGLAYIPAREQGMIQVSNPVYQWEKGDMNIGSGAVISGTGAEFLPEELRAQLPRIEKAQSPDRSIATEEVLIAWDPVAQKERWRVSLGAADWAGGVLATAGNLVVQGRPDGMLVVYRADTGEKLTEIATGTGIMAAPVSYEIDGEQYVAVMAGYGGAVGWQYPPGAAAFRHENYGRILAFKLGGGRTPLPPARVAGETPEPPALPFYTDALAAKGEPLYLARCSRCHYGRGETRLSAYPDLHRLSAEVHAVFDSIVLGGRFANAGMASFADLVSADDAKAIQAYLLREQRRLRDEESAARKPDGP
jgi:quinohemoprotein ethanol dehydrogenase